MTNLSSAGSLIAQSSVGSQTLANGGNASSNDGDLVQASFKDILSQVQSVVTGKPRTGFNNANSLAAQTDALTAQTKAAIDSAVAKTKSFLPLGPKTGFNR
jgi:type II secretory pathway component PulK